MSAGTDATAICRRLADERLKALEFETVRLPIGANENEPHVPIYVSPGLASKKKVIVIFGERNQDPTIFSYRVIGDEGVNKGSVINLLKGIQKQEAGGFHDDSAYGIVITNPCQLYWYRGGSRAVSWGEWLALLRESGVAQPFELDPIKNTIPGNRDFREHVRYLFSHVLPTLIHEDAKLNIVGCELTGNAILEYFCAGDSCKLFVPHASPRY